MRTLSNLASSSKPVDWLTRPSIEVDLTRNEVSLYLKGGPGMPDSGPYTLEEAVRKRLVTLHAGARTRGASHTIVFLFARLSVAVRPIDPAADAAEAMSEKDYRAIIKQREAEQKERDYFDKYGRYPSTY